MDTNFIKMNTLFIGLLVFGSVLFTVYADAHCGAPVHENDTLVYPKKPLTYRDLLEKIMDGRDQSRPLYEVYALHPKDNPPALRRVVVIWKRLSNGTLMNFYAGWEPFGDQCYGGPIIFYDESKGARHVKLGFYDILPPPPQYNTGTMVSSCPDRYVISWFCRRFEDKICVEFGRISILTYSPDISNVPWHLVTADLCKNNMPKMDDIRWKFVLTGIQCTGDVLPPEEGDRVKRDTRSHFEAKRHLWP